MFPWNELLNFDEEDVKLKEQINEISAKVSSEALGDIVDEAGETPMDTPDEESPDDTPETEDSWDEDSADSSEPDPTPDETDPPDENSEEPVDEDGLGEDDDLTADDETDPPMDEPEPKNIEASHPHREANSREILSKKLLVLLGEIKISISDISDKAEFESKTVVVKQLREIEDIVQHNLEIVNKTPKEESMLRYAMSVKTFKHIIDEI